jgi:hypothetical protein
MTAAERLDPVVSVTDAPTADEQHAIDAGLAHYNEDPGYPSAGRRRA